MLNLPRALYKQSEWCILAIDFPNTEITLADPQEPIIRKTIKADDPELIYPIR